MKVLITIDDSHCSSKALESVLEHTWPKDVEFRIITVMEPIFAQFAFPASYAIEPIIEAQRELAKYCTELISSKSEQIKKKFKDAQVTSQVLEGMIADAILDEAKQWDADLIILGSHGRKGFQRFLLGSVAEKVASHAHCSVEIIKDKNASETKQATDQARNKVLQP